MSRQLGHFKKFVTLLLVVAIFVPSALAFAAPAAPAATRGTHDLLRFP